jgi:hypothetical protein
VQFIASDDQLFLYEAISSVVVTDSVALEQQQQLIDSLIEPLLSRFTNILEQV